jgi:hypothetical protein
MTDNDPHAVGPDRLVNSMRRLSFGNGLHSTISGVAPPVFAARIFSAKRTEAD